MSRLTHVASNLARRKHRTRSQITGNTKRPRLSVNISNLHISAQVIDDSRQLTLASATTVGQKLPGTMTERAGVIGEQIAKKAKLAKVTKVAFDRGGRLYHGRVKALADAARAGGLEF